MSSSTALVAAGSSAEQIGMRLEMGRQVTQEGFEPDGDVPPLLERRPDMVGHLRGHHLAKRRHALEQLRDRRALANDGMFMVVVQVDKQTGRVVGRPEIITRGFVHGNEEDPIIEEAIDAVR